MLLLLTLTFVIARDFLDLISDVWQFDRQRLRDPPFNFKRTV